MGNSKIKIQLTEELDKKVYDVYTGHCGGKNWANSLQELSGYLLRNDLKNKKINNGMLTLILFEIFDRHPRIDKYNEFKNSFVKNIENCF